MYSLTGQYDNNRKRQASFLAEREYPRSASEAGLLQPVTYPSFETAVKLLGARFLSRQSLDKISPSVFYIQAIAVRRYWMAKSDA